VKVTRPHHPLLNQKLEVLKSEKVQLIVLLPDGCAMKIPRAWTDVDGATGREKFLSSTVFTVETLRELMKLVDALGNRH